MSLSKSGFHNTTISVKVVVLAVAHLNFPEKNAASPNVEFAPNSFRNHFFL